MDFHILHVQNIPFPFSSAQTVAFISLEQSRIVCFPSELMWIDFLIIAQSLKFISEKFSAEKSVEPIWTTSSCTIEFKHTPFSAHLWWRKNEAEENGANGMSGMERRNRNVIRNVKCRRWLLTRLAVIYSKRWLTDIEWDENKILQKIWKRVNKA